MESPPHILYDGFIRFYYRFPEFLQNFFRMYPGILFCIFHAVSLYQIIGGKSMFCGDDDKSSFCRGDCPVRAAVFRFGHSSSVFVPPACVLT